MIKKITTPLFNEIKESLRLIYKLSLTIIVALILIISNSKQSQADRNEYFDQLIHSYYLTTKYPNIVEFKDWGYLVKLENGKKIELRNYLVNNDGYQSYYFNKYFKDFGYLLFDMSVSEAYGFILINLENGKKITISSEPYFSPDKTKFITIDNQYEGEPKATIYESSSFDIISEYNSYKKGYSDKDKEIIYNIESFVGWIDNSSFKVLITLLVRGKAGLIYNQMRVFKLAGSTISDKSVITDNSLNNLPKVKNNKLPTTKKNKDFYQIKNLISKNNNQNKIMEHLPSYLKKDFVKFINKKFKISTN